MPFQDYDAALHRALELCGIQSDYWDIFGHQRFAPQPTKIAILNALEIDCTSQQALERSIDARLLSAVSRVLPPCAVAGSSGTFDLHVPIENQCGRLQTEIHWEDGAVTATEIQLNSLDRKEEIEAGGRRWLRLALPISALCHGELRLGYHRVTARLCDQTAEMWLIGTPDRAWIPPALENGGKSA